MIDYKYFDMIINKDFISYVNFYKRIINHWLYEISEIGIDDILIYSSNIFLTENELLHAISDIREEHNYEYIDKEKVYHNHGFTDIKLSTVIFSNNKDKNLKIHIRPINTLKSDQRGCRLSGLIIDIDDKDREIIDEYLNNDIITNKLIPFLRLPSNLKIGLVLYY